MYRLTLGVCAVVLCSAMTDAASMKFDLGDSTTASPGYVNDIVYNGQDVANAIDTTGAATGVSLTVTSDTGWNTNGPNRSGPLAPTAPASDYFDGETTRDAMFGHTVTFNGLPPRPLVEYTIAGLDPSLTYDFTFYASRGAVSDIREAQYDVVGLNAGVALLDAGNNVGNIAQVLGIAPTAAGEVVMTIQPGPNNNNSSGFYYLGGLDINPVPEPATLCLMGLGGVLIAVRRGA